MSDIPDFSPPLRAAHHCRHYSYEWSETRNGPVCAVGKLGADEAVTKCMPNPNSLYPPCGGREEYTAEERAAYDEWRGESIGRFLQILPLIPGDSSDRKNKPEWGKGGEFECPACKVGKVRWARARINGHVHAACSTPFCFQVIQ